MLCLVGFPSGAKQVVPGVERECRSYRDEVEIEPGLIGSLPSRSLLGLVFSAAWWIGGAWRTSC